MDFRQLSIQKIVIVHNIEALSKDFPKLSIVTSEPQVQANEPKLQCSSKVQCPISKECPIKLRPYQEELCAEALTGQNVIISAPTGSGKTIVAGFIIRDHLLKSMQRNVKAKALFIVPTVLLVGQQKFQFKNLIGDFAEIRGLSGGEANKLNSVIDEADLLVITPQLLINALESRDMENATCQSFTLSLFSLIIFDESHHSKDDHAYNVLMAYYHKAKLANEELPQIIGLTASLGVGGKSIRKLDEAVNYMLEICANMDAKWISSVRQQRNNLAEFIPEILEERFLLEPHNDPEFLDLLRGQMDYLKSIMDSVEEIEQCQELYTQLRAQNSLDPMVQSFQQWLTYLSERIVKRSTQISPKTRELLNFCTQQLRLIYDAILMLNFFGSSATVQFVQEKEKEFLLFMGAKDYIGQIKAWMDVLKLRVQNSTATLTNSPLLNKLICILDEQFLKNSESRVLIFVHERTHCLKLYALLNEKTNHPTDYIWGTSKGTTSSDSKEKLKKFAKGDIKVLCTTSVAEEGIDISACNLIIHYNYVSSNEIARVQRRGRARALNAHSILLTSDNNIILKEEQNELREQLMHEALDEVGKWPREKFEREVDLLVKELNQKRSAKELAELEKIREMQENSGTYKIQCSSCENFLGMSTSIAKVGGSNYIIADPLFWTRILRSETLPADKCDGPECKGSTPHIGQHRCRCRKKLGRVVQSRGAILLPNLFLSEIVFIPCDPDGTDFYATERISMSQWSKVAKLFYIANVNQTQLAEMKDAPDRPEFLAKAEAAVVDERGAKANILDDISNKPLQTDQMTENIPIESSPNIDTMQQSTSKMACKSYTSFEDQMKEFEKNCAAIEARIVVNARLIELASNAEFGIDHSADENVLKVTQIGNVIKEVFDFHGIFAQPTHEADQSMASMKKLCNENSDAKPIDFSIKEEEVPEGYCHSEYYNRICPNPHCNAKHVGNNKKKVPVGCCFNEANYGECKKSNCIYFHAGDELKPKLGQCPAYQRNGQCKNGDYCRYSHTNE